MATLTEIRETHGVKQRAVADYLGVARQTYALYEKEPWRMRGSQVREVCDFLHCKPEDIDDIFLASDVS